MQMLIEEWPARSGPGARRFVWRIAGESAWLRGFAAHLISRRPAPEGAQASEGCRSGNATTMWRAASRSSTAARTNDAVARIKHDEPVLSTETIGGVNEVVDL